MIAAPHLGQGGVDVFWAEMSPCEHLVQIYEDDRVFLDALEGFIGGGINAGDGVIVIATPLHTLAIEDRLKSRGIDVSAARVCDQYISMDAEETISKFLRGERPDENLFTKLVTDVVTRAKGNGRRVRAFGEMVAVLWARGYCGATVHLEHLWHRLCQEQVFSLFCAYPRSGFTKEASESLKEICTAHSRVFPNFVPSDEPTPVPQL